MLAQHVRSKTGREDIHNHHTNLHNHLRNGEPLNCPVELGMAGVVAVNMANESWRTSQMMGWDDGRRTNGAGQHAQPEPRAGPAPFPKVAG